MECLLTTKKNIIIYREMDAVGDILSELSQSQNDRYHVPSDVWFLDFI